MFRTLSHEQDTHSRVYYYYYGPETGREGTRDNSPNSQQVNGVSETQENFNSLKKYIKDSQRKT